MAARLLFLLFCLTLLAACGNDTKSVRVPATTIGDTLLIHAGRPISPEGKLGAGEWSDADSIHLQVDSAHTVTVHFKHDTENLAVRFTGLATRLGQLEPEILLDVNNSKDSVWQADDLLLHVGYQDCEGRGRFDSLTCGMLQRGWFANNLPLESPGIVEFKISFARLGVAVGDDARLGLAFALLLPTESRTFWPLGSDIAAPVGWGTAFLPTK